MIDEDLMRRALFHAGRAAGATTPNPLVGAVVVSAGGVIVGQARHPRAGDPHAEVLALDEAGPRALGGTLFVTLEPCCHHGRTPPCTARIIESGVARVVVAMVDPNPIVHGRGISELRAAGIRVDVGLLEAEARRLNRPFVTVQTLGRPEVIIKAATSADGRIAARPGERTAISSPESARRTQHLRAMADAVAVGAGTVLADDPLLTARDMVRSRPLTRVVFDRRLRTPPRARLLATVEDGPVIILTTDQVLEREPARARALQDAGATVAGGGDDIARALRRLVAYDISSVLVEGGALVHRALLDADLVDTAHLIVAPVRLGPGGVLLFGTGDVGMGGTAPRSVERVGPDTWMEFDVHGNR
ncbi:MAG: bifunctional diaminohydroxyphosphoribosylaminopyrimidine deaminase/5-amino-6-(5-phosphoribosylamino)uracil reductase RibD [Acidobacteria bacterium]|nr:bifunctional diaminohydroxyphosphoribosylaminopyrimidine deaminase/5-amino-6-(5-phosphoribosylamino)uracil reductase RibD [Acidobacteriota bacterium]